MELHILHVLLESSAETIDCYWVFT